MSRLHRFLHDGEELLAYLLKVDLMTHCGAVACHHLSSVIPATIKPAIDSLLYASAQRLKERGND